MDFNINIYSHDPSYKINSGTSRSNSPKFSPLLIFQTFNHGLNHSKIQTALQLCDLSVCSFSFSAIDRVWLINMNERALSGNEQPPFLSYFFVKKYLLVGASGMLWTGQWASE